MDLPEQVEIQRRHTIIISHPREKVHEDQLRIPFSSITRFLLSRSLLLRAAFHDDNCRRPSPSNSYKPSQSAHSIKTKSKGEETYYNAQHRP